jgi:NAD(P)-dependent dehydrogenase (short-subunit alcohol dehydrogenase family)
MGARLEKKVALVFGAGSSSAHQTSNGQACALAYAREGASVVAVDLELERARATCARVEEEGGRAVAVEADVTCSSEVKAAIERAIEAFTHIDILHNNVGVLKLGGPVDLSEDDWDLTLDTNLKSAFLTCKHTLPYMEARGQGVVTNVSSTASLRVPSYPFVAYAASKAALNHFTRSVAYMVAPKGIRVNAILPGLIDGPIMDTEPKLASFYGDREKLVEARKKSVPMGTMGSVWDVANAAVFLASAEAAYVTGALLPVDGGLTLR